MYILYGENEVLINNFIDDILRNEDIEDKVIYNYNECKIEDVIEEAGYFDLFGNKKLIILNECDFLTSKSTLDNKSFDNFISSFSNEAIIVFKVIIDKLDDRKKLVKTLKEKAVVKEFKLPDENNIDSYIKNYFDIRGYNIDKASVLEISNRLKGNTKAINKELEKLEIYKFKDKNINLEDVKKVIIKYEENNVFKLVDVTLKKDKAQIFSLYKSLIDDKQEPTVLLVLLANQFRLMYQANVLFESGMDKYKIASQLKEHHYRVQLALEYSRDTSKDEILSIIYRLSEIDFKIKTGLIDKTNALESFFLEL